MSTNPTIAIDSQCLTYLIDVIQTVVRPTDDLALEKIALFRLYLYLPATLEVTPTVEAECAKIRNVTRRELHESFISVLFGQLPPPSAHIAHLIDNRATELGYYHKGINDCRILAECEFSTFDYLLTYDDRFHKNLSGRSKVNLQKPSELWANLGIPKGTPPTKRPHSTNPLDKEQWWVW